MSKTTSNKKNILVLFPHQLFLASYFPSNIDEVHLIEEPLFYGDSQYPLTFHKQKLMFHKASMGAYREYLEALASTEVIYHEYNAKQTARTIIDTLTHVDTLYYFDVADYELEKRIRSGVNKTTNLVCLDSPMFFNTREYNQEYFGDKKTYRMHHFYEAQRKRLDILINKDGTPAGGQWSYDEDNRKSIPKKEYDSIPQDPKPNMSPRVKEAKQWVEKHFPKNYGSVESFYYPIDRTQALDWLENFMQEQYDRFGDYEDAIHTDSSRLWHSILSPLLNSGLLTPQEIIERAQEAYESSNIPINSHEGFIRQVIGWREYMKALYDHEGVSMRNSNSWNHRRELSEKWWTGETGLDPLDNVIKKTLRCAYAHHIERLMIVGNAMFLCHIKPDEAYKWFMELYIDAYDWVMVGNVYGMSQDAAGGLLTTKPYFSGSNYICKMSDYTKSQDWCEIWDALYWSFIIEHQEELSQNHRWSMMISQVKKMSQEKIDNHLKTKDSFIRSLR